MGMIESPSAVASVKGILSEVRLGKKTMENGECSYRPNLPRRRKVSAVRNFPPGCGRHAQVNKALEGISGASQSVPIETTNKLETVVGVQVEDNNELETLVVASRSVPIEATTELESLVGASPSVPMDADSVFEAAVGAFQCEPTESLAAVDEIGDRGGVKELMNGAVYHGDLMNAEAGTAVADEVSEFREIPHQVCLSTLDEVLVRAGRHIRSTSVSNVNGVESVASRRYPPRRYVSAERSFPPFCGRNASLAVMCVDQQQSDMGDKPSSSNVEAASMQQTGDDGIQEEDIRKNELGGNVPEVVEDEIQAERKICIRMKMVSGDRRKNCIGTPQASNQYQVAREDVGQSGEKLGKQIVVYREHNKPGENCEVSGVLVLGLMAASNCPWIRGKEVKNRKPVVGAKERKRKKRDGGTSERKCKKQNGDISESKLEKPDCGISKSIQKSPKPEGSKTASMTKIGSDAGKKPRKMIRAGARKKFDQGTCQQLVVRDKEPSCEQDEIEVLDVVPISCYTDVSLPPFGLSSELCGNGRSVTRNKVRETLRLFQAVRRKLLQEEETKSKEAGPSRKRLDYQAARILKDKGKYLNCGKQILGDVPGVEVGDEFHYRVELNMIGLHRQIQGGIDYVKHKGKILATSIVASGGYADDLDDSNSLTYTGQGGNMMNTDKEPEDQKLERGNLALKNSMHEKNPVRVIRGSESSDGKSRTYIYDGLYMVVKCWQDLGSHNKLVFKFQLDRIGGQPELAWKQLKKSKKIQVREGICVDDISGGKESIPICAVNTIDDEKPPPFNYITSVIYPDWCRPLPLRGCSCTTGCSDSEKCSCAVMNGGEISYNFNGDIVEAKPLVYECGPSCKCPPSCHNRVSQHGIKFQLEIFKTESMGWGVRSLNSIPSGSFICEYIGELLEDKEAEARTGNDEYLFDIGNNYLDNSLWGGLSTLMPNAQSSSNDLVKEGGFTIDAAVQGNVGRFINHCCSPNLYAQNVLFDHEDDRIPHIMLFAAENIPPLQELTYHYNYMVDEVRDSNGNVKKKMCYCGSPECTGRLY